MKSNLLRELITIYPHWLNRYPTTVDHREVPLKEEFMINVVKQDAGLREIPECEDEMKILVKIVKESDWTPVNIKSSRTIITKETGFPVWRIFYFWMELGLYLIRNPGKRS